MFIESNKSSKKMSFKDAYFEGFENADDQICQRLKNWRWESSRSKKIFDFISNELNNKEPSTGNVVIITTIKECYLEGFRDASNGEISKKIEELRWEASESRKYLSYEKMGKLFEKHRKLMAK